MSSISESLKFFLNLNVVQAMAVKRFDTKLSSHGISLNDFLILYHVSQAPEEKLRRMDLAEKIGLTASGVTRMLSPLEKIGLVRREANSRDARVSYVKLAPAGRRILNDAMATAESASEQILNSVKTKKAEDFNKFLIELGGTAE
ncbi:MarR family winged helix-turn-helix transcriptional regulator [Dyadobacter sp. CY312]|uniref:MarR family winged helix-turn-helix transcriptional regulator n=1 Tax=Dyadobacter sp. CY312 TaxID=2907303 RepID=UPI001F27E622|nr:MarR family transcriptional regulator [Dyadobacter sp. CY312]MCE7039373.1 MarR family transcriptional regulator [Dyadobacter sp. CY312]